MTDIKKLLGANIKFCRTNLGISQARLAEMVNMATNYLGLIENGKKFPSAEMLERIAASLGKDTIDLFDTVPIKNDWKKMILKKIEELISEELDAEIRKTQ